MSAASDRQVLTTLLAASAGVATIRNGGPRHRVLRAAVNDANARLFGPTPPQGDRAARATEALDAMLDLMRAAGVPSETVVAVVSRHRLGHNTAAQGETPRSEAVLRWLIEDGLNLEDGQ